MKRNKLLAILLIGVGLPVSVTADEDLTGTWKVRLMFGGRVGRISILQFHRDGPTLSGEMLDYVGGKTELDKLQYDQGNLSFEVSREWDGRKFTAEYTGIVADDKIEGTTEYQRRGRARSLNWEATRTSADPVSGQLEPPPVMADISLTAENYVVWREHILPAAEELAWEEIPWLTTFKDGILAAAAADKPLLLWTMNGHPLGCT